MRLRSVVAMALAVVTIAACRPEPVPPIGAGPGRTTGPSTEVTVRPRPPRPVTTTTDAPRRGGGGGGGGGGGSSAPRPTTTTTTAAPTTTTTSTSTTTTTAPPTGGSVLWRSTEGWQATQVPAVAGALQRDRITTVEDPERGQVMRIELRPFGSAAGLRDGDVTNTGGYEANRSEVYARHASPASTPAAQWPDPIGSTRWYGVDIRLASDFVTDTTGRVWMSVMQWKGLHGGQPAIALEVKNDRFELAGASARNDLGRIRPGVWERFVIGVHFHPDSGWVEVHRDGRQVLPRTYRATQQWQSPGVVDPTYLKQGIYRDTRWMVTHVVEYGPTTIGTTKESVL